MKQKLASFKEVVSDDVRTAFDQNSTNAMVFSALATRNIHCNFLKLFDVSFFILAHSHGGYFSSVEDVFALIDRALLGERFSLRPEYELDFDFYSSVCFDKIFENYRSALLHYLQEGLRYDIAPNSRVFFDRLGLSTLDITNRYVVQPSSRRVNDFPTIWHFIDHVVRNDAFEDLLELEPHEFDAQILAAVGRMLAGRKRDALALQFFDRYAELAVLTPAEQQLTADLNLNLNHVDSAAMIYTSILGKGHGNLWTRINLARCLAAMNMFAPACEIILAVRDQVISNESFCRYFDEICTSHLEFVKRDYRVRGSEDETTIGDTRAIEAACAQVDGALRQFYAYRPIPQAPSDRTIIGILANQDLPQCWFYRVEQKRLYLESLGHKVRIYKAADLSAVSSDMHRLDVLIVHRIAYSVQLAKLINELQAQGVSLCYDIDDLIFDVGHYPGPFVDWNDSIPRTMYLDLACGTALFKFAISKFQDVVVSTEELRDAVLALFPDRRVHVLRNGVDPRFDDFALNHRQDERLPRRFFTIIYGTGSLAQRPDWLEVAEPALRSLLAEHDNVRVIFVGPFEPRELMELFPDRFIYYEFCQLEEYWSLLSQSDATLSVLRPLPRNAAKSELKWTEAAYFGVPSVICGGGAIMRATEHGRNALHAHSAAETLAMLSALVTEPALHRDLRARAHADAIHSLGHEHQAQALVGILRNMHRTRQLDLRPVIMVVNVFFWPEMVGGATRIVKEEVDDLIDSLSDRYRIVVVCGRGLTGTFEPYVTDYTYRGICVHQMCYPQYEKMDWHYANEEHHRLFADIIAAERPRLIHFHAVQRLTASVVAAAAEAGVPYLVTVHDGWWIADDMFFKDGADIAVPVSPEVDGAPEPPASVLRRVALAHLLRLAAEVIVVSEQFRNIYAGMVAARYHVITNGSDPVPPVPRPTREPGRFALGFIGGLSSHKGFDLIRLVFNLRAFPNLRLVIVDHAMMAGESRKETWGENRIERVGRVEQAEVGHLYARLDYLLAPSLWPESFGLVSREATLAGVYVVASDRGAMGDDLVEGVTGSRIAVDSHEPLLRLLAAVDEGRFRPALPVPFVPVKSTRQQAEEVRACLLGHLEGGAPAALLRA